MIILGIDPGYERLGIAILSKEKGKEILLYSSCVRTSPKSEHAERLKIVADSIKDVIEKFKPERLAIESLFFTKNQKTAISVAESRGAILVEAARAGLNIYEYGPGEIKVAVTGYGKAEKDAVSFMVKKILKLPESEKLDDEYDAIAVALSCAAIEK